MVNPFRTVQPPSSNPYKKVSFKKKERNVNPYKKVKASREDSMGRRK